jgi:hypothetical protein
LLYCSGQLSVSSAGDINGDGLDDLIIGAQKADPSSKASAGKSYVIFGKTDYLLECRCPYQQRIFHHH